MSRDEVNIVWLKRDLRTQDHAPLYTAENQEIPYIIVYIFEPSIYNYPDTSSRHLRFIYQSLLGIENTLKPYNRNVEQFHCEATTAFTYLTGRFEVKNVYSYQESGIQHTWNRDKEIAQILAENGVKWQEFQRDNIIRGMNTRKDWKAAWLRNMNQPLVENKFANSDQKRLKHPFTFPQEFQAMIEVYPAEMQPPGEYNAWRYLNSFAIKRGKNYFKHISKPAQSRTGCGRISPYLAWGNLSLKQAYHFVNNHPNREQYKRAYEAFLLRLQWRCHFIQKFEVECRYETEPINRGFSKLEYNENEAHLQAWKEGNTGYPLIDACMRCVNQTGWINFRMRAMLVSLLCHHMNLDWRSGMYHLARQFLDYEPGIHYPQFQMQAGTTGTNLVRIYNPVKQSKDHDPEGKFIKKWVPELANVSVNFIHEPWTMTQMDQVFCQVKIGVDYPPPLFNLEEKAKIARDKIWGQQKSREVINEKKRILQMHVNPK